MKKINWLLVIVVIGIYACSNAKEEKVQEYEDALSLSELGDLNRKVLEFDDASAYNKDLVAVKLKGRWGLLNYKTNELIQPLTFDTISFENGYWSLVNDDGWSTSMNVVLDENGKIVFSPKNFDIIEPIDTNLFVESIIVDDDNIEKLIDSKKKELAPPFFNHTYYYNNSLILMTKYDELILAQKQNGKMKLKNFGKEYFNISPSKEQGLFIACNRDEKYGIINEDGQIIIPFQYDYCSDFFLCELLIVSKDDMNYVIDKEGNVIFSTNNELCTFSEGLLLGRDSDGNFLFMNEKGINQFKLEGNINDELDGFSDGVAIIRTEDSSEETPDGKCGLIDKKGNYIIPLQYYQMYKSEDRIRLRKSFMGKVGLYNIEGKEILPFEYETIGDFHNGIAQVKKDGSSYFVNRNGETGINDFSQAIREGKEAKKKYLEINESELYERYKLTVRGSIYRVLNKKNRDLLGDESEIRDLHKKADGTYSAKYEYKTNEGKYFVELHGLKFDEKGHFAKLPTESNMEVKFVHDMIHVNHDNEVYALPFRLPTAEEQMMYYNYKLMQGNRYNPFR